MSSNFGTHGASDKELVQELKTLLIGSWLTDFANFAAFVAQNMPDLNWSGFYLVSKNQLRLGPFIGKPACTDIAFDRGVCGAAYSRRESLIVPNVREFPGHIACDSASNSELVVPLVWQNECLGVFDLDSPKIGRFTEQDRVRVEQWVQILLNAVPAEELRRKPWAIV